MSSTRSTQQTLWEKTKQALPWKQIQLSWDFLDTACAAGIEFGSMFTDAFSNKDDETFLSAYAILGGLSIGVMLAYYEYVAHRALNDYLDPDEKSDLSNLNTDDVELTTKQKLTIGIETITHTTEKANGTTQVLRAGISFLANKVPAFQPYSHAAKGVAHAFTLFGAFMASGQEAKNIEQAFKHQNALELKRR